MSIIEKLGYDPALYVDGNAIRDSIDGFVMFEEQGYGKYMPLFAAAPRMLQELIYSALLLDIAGLDAMPVVRAIELATGRSWKEIVELMEVSE